MPICRRAAAWPTPEGWIESKLKEQAEQGYHAVLDGGGRFTGFSALVEDVPVIEAPAAQGTDVIGLVRVGPEQTDLDYLDAFLRRAAYQAKSRCTDIGGRAISSNALNSPSN